MEKRNMYESLSGLYPSAGNEANRDFGRFMVSMENFSQNRNPANATNPYGRSYSAESKRVFDLCCDFLVESRAVPTMLKPQIYKTDKLIGVESLQENFDLGRSLPQLHDLVERSGVVPRSQQNNAVVLLAALLSRAKNSTNDRDFLTKHFAHADVMDAKNIDLGRSVFPDSLSEMLSNVSMPSNEAFGASIDTVLPDLRAAMTVTLLQFHRGLCDRVLHRRTNGTPYIRYVVPYAEIYDMLKSNDPDHKVRNQGDHYEPFINLYADPRSVSNQLQPIVPLKANDTDGNKVWKDGVLYFDAPDINLFDLSVVANQLGKSHYNLTDLVSENVALDSIYVKVKKAPSTEEIFKLNVRQLNGVKLLMLPNSTDSGLRGCIFAHSFRFDKNMTTIEGKKTELLKDCTATDYIRVDIRTTHTINLKYADVEGYGTIVPSTYNSLGAAIKEEVTTMLSGLTFELVGYQLDATYSEENLRKSNLAIRSNVRTFDFEISNGRNIMIDYSFQEELPEFLMSLVTEATSLGQDHRALDVIVKELMYVFDETQKDSKDPNFHSKEETIGFNYVSSQMVRPVVYLGTIDLDEVDTIRSSDFLGDIRQYVEWQLLNMTSLVFQNSFFTQQLDAGESPKFKVITSEVIKSNLLSIPHIHNHLNHDETPSGNDVEYRRVLPNGVVLDVVTCTYNYVRDKIIMIPYRDNAPESYLNFGHNWDYGTFVANYNPQIDNAVNKRVFANSRTMVVPTCPIGLYLDVRNISKIIDMFQILNPKLNGSSLPSPSDTLEQADGE